MPDQKITQLTAVTSPDGDELIPLVDDPSGTPTTKYITRDNLLTNFDGWFAAPNTWVYASATTFTIAGVDRTAIYTIGTRIRFKQGGAYKYGTVASSSFSTNTTVTLIANDDYSIANAAITNNYYSYQAAPQGYPGWFGYTPTTTGFSSQTSSGRFMIVGKMVFVHISISGTSNTTGFTTTLPTTFNGLSGFENGGFRMGDNGGQITATVTAAVFTSASAVLTFYKDWNGTGWTASGTKNADVFLTYQP